MPNPRAGILAPVLSVCRVARVEMVRAGSGLQRDAFANGIDIDKRDIFAVMEAMAYKFDNVDSF